MTAKTGIKALLLFFTVSSTLVIGWQIVAFLAIYFAPKPTLMADRLFEYVQTQPVVLAVLIMYSLFVLIIAFRINIIHPGALILDFRRLIRHISIQIILAMILSTDQILYQFTMHIKVLQLIQFIISLWLINDLGKLFESTDVSDWRHATTRGMFIFSGILTGFALLFSKVMITGSDTWHGYLLIVVLILYLVAIFARIRYLSGATNQTRYLSRQLLFSRYGLYFGIRIVLGLFMPLGYLVYGIWVNPNFINAVVPFIFVGEVLDKFLFIYVSNAWNVSG